MATGDAAASAGMAVVPGTADRRDGYIEINKTRDYLGPVKTAVEDATASDVPNTLVMRAANGAISVGWAESAKNAVNIESGDIRYLRQIGGTVEGALIVEDNIRSDKVIRAEQGFVTPLGGQFAGAWGNNITSSRRSVFMDSEGRLGYESSTARLKKNITPWVCLTDEQFAALSVVTFQWRDNVDASDHLEVGMIAEELHDLGLSWAVLYDDQDRPAGIHYERVVLAVIPYVQNLAARVTALEAADE